MHLHILSHAFRAFRKQKLYVAITAIGLSLALGASLLILSFVYHELSFEKCHENSSQIYRIGGKWMQGDLTVFLPSTMHPLGPALYDALPDIEQQVRIRRLDDVTIKTDHDHAIEEPKFLLADPSVFSVFSIPLIHGDSQQVLGQPFSVVISEQASEALFARTDPVGQTITIRDSVMLTVTGVMADMPHTTQIRTNFLASFATLEKMGENLNEWNNTSSLDAYTYLLLAEGTNPEVIDERLSDILAVHLDEDAPAYELHLQPLEDIYLKSKLSDELGPTGSLNDVYLFAGISLLLVLMACFNFVNLSTARNFHRYRELLARSVAGASRSQLFVQFLSESVLLTSISMVLGLVFYELFIPHLEAYVGKSLDVGLSSNAFIWLTAPILVFVVGVMSGSYPAAVLLRLRSTGTLTSHMPVGSGKSKLRRSLVVFQAIIAIGLVGFTAGIQKQLSFIENYDYGFMPDNVWLFEFDQDATGDQKERLKREFSAAGLTDATLAFNAPGESLMRGTVVYPGGQAKEDAKYLSTFTGDADFCSTFDLRLVRGHRLSDETVADMPGAVIINESTVELLGLDNPIGAELQSSRGPLKVVGVVKDFLALSFHNKIMPSVITRGSAYQRLLAVRLPERDQAAAMQKMRDTWAKVFPNAAFVGRPLSEVMSDCYSDEQKLISLFLVSSGLAIFIACLGLMGLVSYTVVRRTKEIGIRKSIGASVTSITTLLTGEFVVLIVVAGILAWPLAKYSTTRWLENFVYRTEYGLSTYTLVVGVVLILSLGTVGFQVIKAARANPVDALRHE